MALMLFPILARKECACAGIFTAFASRHRRCGARTPTATAPSTSICGKIIWSLRDAACHRPRGLTHYWMEHTMTLQKRPSRFALALVILTPIGCSETAEPVTQNKAIKMDKTDIAI